MPEPKSKNSQDLLKLIGGLLFLMASVGLMLHRMPKFGYVEAHADKPRPKANVESSSSIAAAPAAPRPPRKAETRQMPGSAPEKPSPTAAARTETAPETPMALEDACAAEIGILCYGVADKQPLRMCLQSYDDALRKDCREVLEPGNDETADAAPLPD